MSFLAFPFLLIRAALLEIWNWRTMRNTRASLPGCILLLLLSTLHLISLITLLHRLLFGWYFFATGLLESLLYEYPTSPSTGLKCSIHYLKSSRAVWDEMTIRDWITWKWCAGLDLGRDITTLPTGFMLAYMVEGGLVEIYRSVLPLLKFLWNWLLRGLLTWVCIILVRNT